jgi:heme oxygenase (mycobilin-producing)
MSTGRVRVLVWHRAPATQPAAVADAYHAISRELAGTPGLVRNELLGSVAEPDSLVVMSEWESLAAFQVWEQGFQHRKTTSPLRPYQDRARGRHYEVFRVVAAY